MRLLLLSLLTLVVACHRPATKASTPPTNVPGRSDASVDAPGQSDASVDASGADVPEPTASEIADYSRYVRQGVSFMAVGNEPFWSLTIQADRQIAFRTPTDSLLLPVPPEGVNATGERTYDGRTEKGELHVRIQPLPYTDSMSGKVFDTTVEVQVKRRNEATKIYRGGGTSLSQLLLLNNIWVLTSLNGEPVAPSPPRTSVPQIEIQLSTGRITGTGGCNQIAGQVRADNRYVAFGQLISTRMACPGADQLEARFLTALEKPFTYRVDNGLLLLSQAGKSVMTFKRID